MTTHLGNTVLLLENSQGHGHAAIPIDWDIGEILRIAVTTQNTGGQGSLSTLDSTCHVQPYERASSVVQVSKEGRNPGRAFVPVEAEAVYRAFLAKNTGNGYRRDLGDAGDVTRLDIHGF